MTNMNDKKCNATSNLSHYNFSKVFIAIKDCYGALRKSFDPWGLRETWHWGFIKSQSSTASLKIKIHDMFSKTISWSYCGYIIFADDCWGHEEMYYMGFYLSHFWYWLWILSMSLWILSWFLQFLFPCKGMMFPFFLYGSFLVKTSLIHFQFGLKHLSSSLPSFRFWSFLRYFIIVS